MKGIGRLILWGFGIVAACVAVAVLAVFSLWLAAAIVVAAAAYVIGLKCYMRRAADPRRRRPVPGDPEPLE